MDWKFFTTRNCQPSFFYLQAEMVKSDVKNLTDMIKRFRTTNVLDAGGLTFNTVCDADIYGKCRSESVIQVYRPVGRVLKSCLERKKK